ncbi:MAG: hypothetical protein K2N74_04790 [Clostridiales bacterium]|nr:hypothetical protein [Clostridiales bacterium]
MKTMKNRKRGVLATIATLGAMCVGVCSFAIGDYVKQAGAYTPSTVPSLNNIGEITLKKYEEREDGLVFDAKKLEELYGKLVRAKTGNPSITLASLDDAKSAVDNYTSSVDGSANTGNTLTQQKALDFKRMQSQLGSPITLSLGGLDWTVVYATTNTTAGGTTKAGDLIVTLWLNDNIGTTSKWSDSESTDMSGDYPTNMYSSSYIRVKTLNAGGDDGSKAHTGVGGSVDGTTYYATSTSSRSSGNVSLTERKTNQFAKYTLSNAQIATPGFKTDDEGNQLLDEYDDPIPVTLMPSLTSFLTAPKNVEYQRAENWVWSYMGSGNPYLCPNEAWGTGNDGVTGPNSSSIHQYNGGNKSGGWYTGSPSNMSLILSKPAYYEWQDDLLWLPSLTETGYYTSSSDYGASLWGIPANDPIIKSTAPTGTGVTDVSWLRSG